jgi:hypothetical protein
MAFIRKVKTASGATVVQIAYKQKGRIIMIIHFGSAHTRDELEILLALARKRKYANQLEIFPETKSTLRVSIKHSYSGLLWTALQAEYRKLGFNRLGDEVFEALCLARIVEPTSKLDSLRVQADLGVDPINRNRLYRCLVKASSQDYPRARKLELDMATIRNAHLNDTPRPASAALRVMRSRHFGEATNPKPGIEIEVRNL